MSPLLLAALLLFYHAQIEGYDATLPFESASAATDEAGSGGAGFRLFYIRIQGQRAHTPRCCGGPQWEDKGTAIVMYSMAFKK